MFRWIAVLSLSLFTLLIAACSSAPKRPSTPLPPALVQKLQSNEFKNLACPFLCRALKRIS